MIEKANTNFINESKHEKGNEGEKKPGRPDAVPVVASRNCCGLVLAGRDGPQGGGKTGNRFGGPLGGLLEHERTQAGHGGRTGALAFFGYRELSGSEVLETKERQFETVLDANLLEKTGKINFNSAFGDHEGAGDFFILKALGQ